MIALVLAVLAAQAPAREEVAAQPPCGPSVRLDGEAELVSRLMPALIARGLAPARRECVAVHVLVASAGPGIRIEARDPHGRLQVRALHDLSNAPSVIEGLIRSGVAIELAAPPARVAASPPVEVRLGLGAEMSMDGAGALASGVRASAARNAGAMAVLLRARWSFAPEVAGGDASRHDGELLAGARRAFSVPGLGLAPGVAVGLGLTRVERGGPRCDARCGSAVIPDHAVATSAVPRVAPSLEITRRLGPGIELDALLEVSISPLAAGPRTPAWASALSAADAADFALPGDPLATLRFGLGLSWGRR